LKDISNGNQLTKWSRLAAISNMAYNLLVHSLSLQKHTNVGETARSLAQKFDLPDSLRLLYSGLKELL
jgi:hypothetical protein